MQTRITLLAFMALIVALAACEPSRRGKTDEEIEETRLEAVRFDEETAKCLQVPSNPTVLPIADKTKAEGLFAAWQHALRQVQEPCNLKVYTFLQNPDRVKDFPIASRIQVTPETLRQQVNAVEIIYVRSIADIVFFDGQYPSLAYFCGKDTLCKIVDRAQMTQNLRSLIHNFKFDLNDIRPGLTEDALEAQKQKGLAETLDVWKSMSPSDTEPFTKDDLTNYLCGRFGEDINARYSDSLRCP